MSLTNISTMIYLPDIGSNTPDNAFISDLTTREHLQPNCMKNVMTSLALWCVGGVSTHKT